MNDKTFARLSTERAASSARPLDRGPLAARVSWLVAEQARAAAAVRRSVRSLARAAALLAERWSRGGRIFFVGAGTSGRLGVLEAAECPPTFNTPPARVRALMAGGRSAVFRSREGAEDRTVAPGLSAVRADDVVVGVAASGVTPFVRAALRRARARRAGTVLVTCNRPTGPAPADVVVVAPTGPEPLTGSTRLKAGTATKIILNTLTTLAMAENGKIHGHWMVDLQPRSAKLRARARRLVARLGGVTERRADALLSSGGGNAKTAILMARRGLGRSAAERRLRAAGGFLERALRA